ncbi:MAG: cytochrome b N-terminal domain-containing protein, partial [Myxococcales bacterium]|nr:cytochrome b N-terminal domain-containing protein [Myxococcales bacterium]
MAGRLRAWLDDRLGLGVLSEWAVGGSVPGGARLRYVFGWVLLYLFIQQAFLGILLAFYYSPSVTSAWASTAYLNDQVVGGWFIRGLHYHGASAMIVVIVLHLLQVVFAGAYRKPREVNWWSGLALAGIVILFAFTGYPLPWDQGAYWSTQVRSGIIASAPGGEVVRDLMQGGSETGNLTLTRYYALHVFVLPLAFTLLAGLHLYLRRRHGPTPPVTLSDEEAAARAQPFWPNQLFLAVVAMALCGVILLVATIATHGSELYAPADPSSNFTARPEWYFLGLYQLLKLFPGPLAIVGKVVIPGALAAFLFALPWVDRAESRRPRARLGILAAIAAILSGAVALSAVAIVDDANNEALQEGLAEAAKEAEKARELAKEGVPPAGGVAVWENDPEFAVRALFREHCAHCHLLDGKGGEEGPSFDDYGTREWVAAIIRNPADPRFYGGTKHNTMEPLPVDDLGDDDLRAVSEYVYSLMGESAKAVDSELAARGKAIYDDKLECSGCHELEGESTGPALKGRGSVDWLKRIIADSSAADLYTDTAEMPKFTGKLTPEEIEALQEG